MADIASRPAFAPRLPWRAIGAALIVLALLRRGWPSRTSARARPEVPPPFGPARNGQIVFAANGDIYTGDPIAGTNRAIVTGPEMDGNPRFSRDGTRVAFMRQVTGTTAFVRPGRRQRRWVRPQGPVTDTARHGRSIRMVAGRLVSSCSPIGSSGSFASMRPVQSRRSRWSTTPTSSRASSARQMGARILYEPQDVSSGVNGAIDHGHALWVMNADGSGKTRPL